MGLDTVELVMEIEEAFDITIPDDRASEMVTVGDVYEFILEKTCQVPLESGRCLSAAVFYELSRQVRGLGLVRGKIRPNTELDQVIPLTGRRSTWKALSSQMDLRFPRLGRPGWLALLNCMFVAIVFIASLAVFAQSKQLIGVFVALGLGILSSAAVGLLTEPFAIYPAATCSTIRDLVTHLVAINYSKLAGRYASRNPTDVWNALQLIVSEQLGVDRSKVLPHARFVQDLGAD
jgi:acyl carrier protein